MADAFIHYPSDGFGNVIIKEGSFSNVSGSDSAGNWAGATLFTLAASDYPIFGVYTIEVTLNSGYGKSNTTQYQRDMYIGYSTPNSSYATNGMITIANLGYGGSYTLPSPRTFTWKIFIDCIDGSIKITNDYIPLRFQIGVNHGNVSNLSGTYKLIAKRII